MASKNVQGSLQEQYKMIYDYAHELLGSKPGSIIKVKVEENMGCQCLIGIMFV